MKQRSYIDKRIHWPVTAAEVQKAVAEYLARGGRIEHLPPEPAVSPFLFRHLAAAAQITEVC